MGPKIYLHKVMLLTLQIGQRAQNLTCRGPGSQNGTRTPGPNHDSPNRAKVVGPKLYLHKVDLLRVLLVKSCGAQNLPA